MIKDTRTFRCSQAANDALDALLISRLQRLKQRPSYSSLIEEAILLLYKQEFPNPTKE